MKLQTHDLNCFFSFCSFLLLVMMVLKTCLFVTLQSQKDKEVNYVISWLSKGAYSSILSSLYSYGEKWKYGNKMGINWNKI